MGLLALLLVLLAPARPRAHDIPIDVLVQVFVRAEGQTLHVLVRSPLAAMRDFNFPTRDGVVLLDTRDHDKLDSFLRDAAQTWIVPALNFYEEGRPVALTAVTGARVSLPSDRSFADYEQARRHMTAPKVPGDVSVAWNHTYLDVSLEYAISSGQAHLSIDPQFARFGVRVVTVLRFSSPGQPERAFQFSGDPGLVAMDPRWHQAALRFVHLGFDHILDGVDHLLFLFCLVIPIRRIGQLVLVVTAFTVAHSITLFASAFGFAPSALWFPPLIETLIAVSIVYMALENIVFAASPGSLVLGPGSNRRWMFAFAFGLVHGFGFSFALQETLQFAGSHIVLSLASFNIGVELGQLLVLALLVPGLALLFRYVMPEKIGVIILSALVAHTAWHWMIERGSTLGEYDWSMDAITLARGVRWLMVGVGLLAAIWLMSTARKASAKGPP